MKFEKTFEITIDVVNPINFCINKQKNVLTYLNNNYENKCYLGTFILEIKNILKISNCKIVDTNSSSNGVINVKFSAEVYVLNQWDIVIGSKIKEKSDIAISNYEKNNLKICITFKPTNIHANTLSVNQLLPIRIIKSVCKPNYSHIIAIGVLLTCDKKSTVYKVKGKVHNNALPEINILLNNIKNEILLRTELMKKKKKEIIFFESLLYSYKNINKATEFIQIDNDIKYEGLVHNTEGLIGHNIFNIIDINLDGYWSRPLGVPRSSPILALSNSDITNNNYILINPQSLIIDVAKNILNYLVAVRELTEVYNTPELIHSHENIWTMMNEHKLNKY